VGGKLIVENGKLLFIQTLMNKIIHTTDNDLEIDLKKIDRIWWHIGWFTGIINIEVNKKLVKLRCFGAKRVDKRLSAFIIP